MYRYGIQVIILLLSIHQELAWFHVRIECTVSPRLERSISLTSLRIHLYQSRNSICSLMHICHSAHTLCAFLSCGCFCLSSKMNVIRRHSDSTSLPGQLVHTLLVNLKLQPRDTWGLTSLHTMKKKRGALLSEKSRSQARWRRSTLNNSKHSWLPPGHHDWASLQARWSRSLAMEASKCTWLNNSLLQ